MKVEIVRLGRRRFFWRTADNCGVEKSMSAAIKSAEQAMLASAIQHAEAHRKLAGIPMPDSVRAAIKQIFI